MLSQRLNSFFSFLFFLQLRNIPLCECPIASFFLFKILFIFRERGRMGERGEKHQCVVASCAPPTGDLACTPGVCPDWESNQQPFGLQAATQSTEPDQPGLYHSFFIHSFTVGHLGRFQALVIVINTAMNIGVHIFFLIGDSRFCVYNVILSMNGSIFCTYLSHL